jgi:hypothetical protein
MAAGTRYVINFAYKMYAKLGILIIEQHVRPSLRNALIANFVANLSALNQNS